MRFAPEQCPCGRAFALIDEVGGRAQEILSFPAAAGGSANVHPIVFHEIMERLPVGGWQVVQEEDGLHVLLAGARGPLDEEELAATVRRTLAQQGAAVSPVGIQKVDSIPQNASGKTPLVKRNLPEESGAPQAAGPE